MKEFFCDMCGECCRNIDKIEVLKDYNLGNGICKYLDGKLCRIYSTRPDVCNVAKMYELVYKDVMSEEEYIELNREGCRLLKNNWKTK